MPVRGRLLGKDERRGEGQGEASQPFRTVYAKERRLPLSVSMTAVLEKGRQSFRVCKEGEGGAKMGERFNSLSRAKKKTKASVTSLAFPGRDNGGRKEGGKGGGGRGLESDIPESVMGKRRKN